MQARTLLTTSDIMQMSLEAFLGFRQEKGNLIPSTEFEEANSDWLLISDLEDVKSLKALKKLIGQLKEDLWWDIQNRQEIGGHGNENIL